MNIFERALCSRTLFLSLRIPVPWKICVQNSNEGKTQLNRECPSSNQELNMPDTKPANVTHVKPVAHQEGQRSQCADVETNLFNTKDSAIKTFTLVSLSAALPLELETACQPMNCSLICACILHDCSRISGKRICKR